MKKHCKFCVENKIREELLFETENLFIMPDLGPIAKTHLLILPKKHYVNIGNMPKKIHEELNLTIEKIKTTLLDVFGEKTILFEHGPASITEKGGNSIDHAHLHLVTHTIPLIKMLKKKFQYLKINQLNELKSNAPYLFVEENNERYSFNISSNIPSQYLRKIIAEKNELPWNWRENQDNTDLFIIHDRLHKHFKKNNY